MGQHMMKDMSHHLIWIWGPVLVLLLLVVFTTVRFLRPTHPSRGSLIPLKAREMLKVANGRPQAIPDTWRATAHRPCCGSNRKTDPDPACHASGLVRLRGGTVGLGYSAASIPRLVRPSCHGRAHHGGLSLGRKVVTDGVEAKRQGNLDHLAVGGFSDGPGCWFRTGSARCAGSGGG